MRTNLLILGAAAAFSLVATGGSAATASPDRAPPRTTQLQAALDAVVAAGVPGALVLVRNGDRTVRLTAGYANLARRTPMRVTDRFRIGSETKMFVSTVVLQLVGEGKLSLDDTVERRLPGLVPNGRNITVRQLLNHTSGLYDYAEDKAFLAQLDNPRKVWTPRRLIALATAHKPLFRPGTKWGYSNTGYIALGLIVEATTGHTLGAELRKRIFEPLRLRATSFATRPQIAGRYAHGYSRLGQPRLYDISFIDPSLFWAAGAIVSTADDLVRFHDALLRGRLLRPNLLAAMKTTVNVTPQQGYGLGIIRWRYPCGTFWGHGGGIFGYETFTASTGDSRRHVVIALNADESVRSRRRDDAFGRLLERAYCQG
jgi:D-alanyl-D-alanine carboxypeptidase